MKISEPYRDARRRKSTPWAITVYHGTGDALRSETFRYATEEEATSARDRLLDAYRRTFTRAGSGDPEPGHHREGGNAQMSTVDRYEEVTLRVPVEEHHRPPADWDWPTILETALPVKCSATRVLMGHELEDAERYALEHGEAPRA